MNQHTRQAQGREGFSQIILLSVIAILILTWAGGFFVFQKKDVPSSEKIVPAQSIQQSGPETQPELKSKSTSQSVGLGTLCTGEDECRIICEKERKACQDYCRQDLHNKLCSAIIGYENLFKEPAIGQQKEDCISNSKPVFTHPFTDIAKISEISRFGNSAFINPGSQVRNYVVVEEGESTPVYATIDMKIKRIHYSDKNYSQFFGREFIRPEYRINFQISCEVEMAYDHIVSLADKFKVYAPQVSSPGKNDGVEVSILVQAGEVIGYTSGGFPGKAFDFIFLNKARVHPHLNPSRWTSDHSRYMDCPFDYFPDELRGQYIALIPEVNGMRNCGPNVREVPNTLLGYWFKEDATETQGNRFSISVSKHFVEWVLLQGTESPISYRDHDAGRVDPETITEGKSVCYYDSDRNSHIYAKMLPNDKIGLASGTGVCPSAFPNEHEVFER